MGVCASRKSAQACERLRAFLARGGQERPAFRTSSDFRTLPLEALREVCVQGLRRAGEAGMGQWGHLATDGTHIQGQASRHQAMSYGSRHQAVDRWRADLAALVTQAYPQDAQDEAALGRRRGAARPAALARRDARLATIEAAMRRLEARAQAAADAERQRRAEAEAERQRTGPRRRGQAPTPVQETSDDQVQTNCTAPALQLMRPHNQGWEYGGHAHARVEAASQIIVAGDVTAEAHDPPPAAPLAPLTVASLAQAGIATPTDAAGTVQTLPATSESGYDSAAAATAVEQRGCAPSRAPARQRHHVLEAERTGSAATAPERRAAHVRTPAGRAGSARRTVIVAPVLGQRQEGRGWRRCLRRGLDHLRGAGRLVCVTPHVLTSWRHACAPLPASPQERTPYVPGMLLYRVSSRRQTPRFSPSARGGQQACDSLHTNRRLGLEAKCSMR